MGRFRRVLVIGALACWLGPGPPEAASGSGGAWGEDGRSAPPGRPPTAIVNRVLELLDEPVALEFGTDHAVWESRVFDVEQFDTIVMKPEADVVAGFLPCAIAWSFGPEDWFEDLTFVPPSSGLWQIEMGGFGPLVPQRILGLRGKIVCQSIPAFGNDQGPGPGFGTLRALRIILRRH